MQIFGQGVQFLLKKFLHCQFKGCQNAEEGNKHFTFLHFLKIKPSVVSLIHSIHASVIYRLITAYLLLQVNLDKIMHARGDFDAFSARTRRVSALDKHQN